MVYYTQLIYINEGKEDMFHEFEDRVLPLLPVYNGRLLYRIKPTAADVIAADIELPYELHLLTFSSQADMAAYAHDDIRQQYLSLKNEAVARVLLIEGAALT